jgi:hypothetical protein
MDLNGCFFTNMHYRYKDYLKVGEKAWNGLSKEILAFGKGGCPKGAEHNGCFFTNMHYRYKDYLKVGEKAWNGLSKEILAFGKGGCPKGAEHTLSAHE